MLTELTGQDLPQWIAAARSEGLPGIASFAMGLEQDLELRPGRGPREPHQDGQTADVRPGRLPLLRKRVLLTAKT